MQRIILFLLFLLPLVILPFYHQSVFELPKVYLAEVLIETLFIIVIFQSKKFFKQKPLSLLIPLGGLFLVSLLALFFHPSSLSFFGNSFRLQGTFLLWHLLFFCFISSKFFLPKISLKFLLAILFLEVLAVIFLGTTTDGRAYGTLGEPNALGALVIFLWPWSLSLIKKNNHSQLIVVGIYLVTLFIIFSSGSRSSFIAFCLQSIFLLAIYKTKLSEKIIISIICGLYVLSLLLPFFTPQTEYENRAEIWKTALIAGLKSPIIGNGFGNTQLIMHETSISLHNKLVGYTVDSAHNVFLDFWVQGGALGVSCFLFLLFHAFKKSLQKKDYLSTTLLIGIITCMSFNPVSVVTLVQLWWLLGKKASDLLKVPLSLARKF